MSVPGLILGLVNIGIVVALLLIFGLAILWMIKTFGGPEPDPQMRKFYLLFVLLVAIYMLLALVFGMPTVHIFGSGGALPFRG